MKLLYFLSRETGTSRNKIVFFAALSGIANAFILILINIAAEQVSNDSVELQLLLLYLSALLIYIFSERYALHNSTRIVENALAKLKIRIVNKLRHAELRFIEENNEVSDYTPLVQDINLLSQGATRFVAALESIMMLSVSSIYLAFLSPAAFLSAIILFAFIIPIFIKNYKKEQNALNNSSQKESHFLHYIISIVKGFKELKLNYKESEELFSNLKKISKESRKARILSNESAIDNMLFSNASFFILLMITVFLLPLFVEEHSEVIYKSTATLLFIVGPLLMLVPAVPLISRTSHALENLYQLDKKLDDVNESEIYRPFDKGYTNNTFMEFNVIRMENLIFFYTDSLNNKVFTSGPHELTLRKSEIVFIVGGNGSGKSTLLKLLTGLYKPDSGCIYVDNEPVDIYAYKQYRELFSIVFTDFHLFDQFYGFSNLDSKEVNFWLREMHLDKKTSFYNNHFTETNLSTGQRKRLAFIIAVLRKSPICVFDELAADQDPFFRQYFYENILANLKAQGRTIIVVSHDDRYFYCADRLLKLEDGSIISDDIMK